MDFQLSYLKYTNRNKTRIFHFFNKQQKSATYSENKTSKKTIYETKPILYAISITCSDRLCKSSIFVKHHAHVKLHIYD